MARLPRLLLFLLLCSCATDVPADRRPNIVILYTDDQGYGDCSAFHPEADFQTQHMDRIARKGTRFVDGHSAGSVCTPSRYALLTGRYAWRLPSGGGGGGGGESDRDCLISDDELTIARLAKQQGYATSMVGKWHLGMQIPGTKGDRVWDAPVTDGPIRKGIDSFYGIQEFRPPSAGGEVGESFTALFAEVKRVLAELDQLFPKLKYGEVELLGLGWHQGWNDRVNQAFNDAYEENLSFFIRDARKELEMPGLPFVIAETGMSGHEEKHPRAVSLMKAQAAVAQREEFRGNVAFVGTKDFWRDKADSPSGQAYHWNNNAETFYLIGEGMGRAMLELISGKQASAARAKYTWSKKEVI